MASLLFCDDTTSMPRQNNMYRLLATWNRVPWHREERSNCPFTCEHVFLKSTYTRLHKVAAKNCTHANSYGHTVDRGAKKVQMMVFFNITRVLKSPTLSYPTLPTLQSPTDLFLRTAGCRCSHHGNVSLLGFGGVAVKLIEGADPEFSLRSRRTNRGFRASPKKKNMALHCRTPASLNIQPVGPDLCQFKCIHHEFHQSKFCPWTNLYPCVPICTHLYPSVPICTHLPCTSLVPEDCCYSNNSAEHINGLA